MGADRAFDNDGHDEDVITGSQEGPGPNNHADNKDSDSGSEDVTVNKEDKLRSTTTIATRGGPIRN